MYLRKLQNNEHLFHAILQKENKYLPILSLMVFNLQSIDSTYLSVASNSCREISKASHLAKLQTALLSAPPASATSSEQCAAFSPTTSEQLTAFSCVPLWRLDENIEVIVVVSGFWSGFKFSINQKLFLPESLFVIYIYICSKVSYSF